MYSLSVDVDLSGLDKILDAFDKEFEAAIDVTTLEVASRASKRAPVDTGALRASGFAVTPSGSDYSAATIQAMAALSAGGKKGEMLAAPIRTERFEGFAAFGMSYAQAVEEGHHVRTSRKTTRTRKPGKIRVHMIDDKSVATYVPGRWFMKAAAEEGRAILKQEARDALERLRKLGERG